MARIKRILSSVGRLERTVTAGPTSGKMASEHRRSQSRMTNSLTRSVMALATALLAVTTIGAQSGTVSGTFAVNGKDVRLQHISVVTYDTPSQGRLISILASDKPPDHKKFVEYVGPDRRSRFREGGLDRR
jgi:hypothetical protein